MEIDKSFVDAMRNERGEARGETRVSNPPPVAMSSTLCAPRTKKRGAAATSMIRHWPRHSLSLSRSLLRQASFKMEDIKLLLFYLSFSFEQRKREREGEREISSLLNRGEEAYETAPTDAIRVEFSSSCKHE